MIAIKLLTLCFGSREWVRVPSLFLATANHPPSSLRGTKKNIRGIVCQVSPLEGIIVGAIPDAFLCPKTQPMDRVITIEEVAGEWVLKTFYSMLETAIANTDFQIQDVDTGLNKGYSKCRLVSSSRKLIIKVLFNFSKTRCNERLLDFLGSDDVDPVSPPYTQRKLVIGIGLWKFGLRSLMKRSESFHMASDQHVIDTFKLFEIELHEDLTLDEEAAKQFQGLAQEEKMELSEMLLEGILRLLHSIIKKSEK